ncbi:MAG: flavodoxin [Bacillota bacterium]
MDRNSVIVYYSWVGNTKLAAEEIQKSTGLELFRIEEKKERNFGSIMGPAFAAFFGFKSGIKPIDFSFQKYENVFIGTPVWAGKITPAINSFLSKYSLKGKNIYIFITKADENVPQKVIDSMTSRIEKKGGKVKGCISLTTKWDPKTNIPLFSEECSREIQEWTKSITKS